MEDQVMSMKKKFLPEKGVCRVSFTLSETVANHSERVAIVGDFNHWHPFRNLMKKDKYGKFKATIELPIGKEYQFRYLIDFDRWENEWDADGLVKTPFEGIYNSAIDCYDGENLA
jgi:1,4-alpha-glucan branching enzyme